ncbi:MAG: endolytic transglycosylase MltG [Betaproteobacteria bacterium]|nr:endolytic transglycosylase MltG [Betaproteobacteria bacterium]
MLKTAERWLKRALWLSVALLVVFAGWLAGYGFSDLAIDRPLQFSLKQGSSLRGAARQMQAAGVLDSPGQFELLARIFGDAGRIQAGNYEIGGDLTPLALLRKVTSGDHSQDQITFVEGLTFGQMRAVLDAHPAIKHDTRGVAEFEIVTRLGIPHPSAEGLFFPDTYYFANGTSDAAILQRAFRAMQSQLDALWSARADGLPLENPYQALILASIIEKESGQPDERPMIAAVFVNRLKLGMKLQADPTVIYGLGSAFDGNLRKRDLLAEGPYNTYTREGLPPTPIAIPGLGALTAALDPAPSKALYFVARGDGTSYFSSTLAEHERAVTKYQGRGNR